MLYISDRHLGGIFIKKKLCFCFEIGCSVLDLEISIQCVAQGDFLNFFSSQPLRGCDQ